MHRQSFSVVDHCLLVFVSTPNTKRKVPIGLPLQRTAKHAQQVVPPIVHLKTASHATNTVLSMAVDEYFRIATTNSSIKLRTHSAMVLAFIELQKQSTRRPTINTPFRQSFQPVMATYCVGQSSCKRLMIQELGFWPVQSR
jgi:hypothetical protein